MTRHYLDFKGLEDFCTLFCTLCEEECFNYRRYVANQLGIRRSLMEGTVPSKDVAEAEETADPEPLTDRARTMVSLSMFTWA